MSVANTEVTLATLIPALVVRGEARSTACPLSLPTLRADFGDKGERGEALGLEVGGGEVGDRGWGWLEVAILAVRRSLAS